MKNTFVIKIEGVEIEPSFQDVINAQTEVVGNSFIHIDFGNAKAMLFNMGKLLKQAYVYLEQNDAIFKSITLKYLDVEGVEKSITKHQYPFEFTIPFDERRKGMLFELSGLI